LHLIHSIIALNYPSLVVNLRISTAILAFLPRDLQVVSQERKHGA